MFSEKLVKKPPGTVTPHQRRRARRYFTLSFFFLLFMALWLLTDYVLPEPNKAGLSARPAPAPTLIMTNWQDITPMNRRSRTATLKKSDSLAALLARIPDQDVEGHLLAEEGEHVIDLVRKHGVVYLRPAAVAVAALLVGVLAFVGPIQLGWFFLLLAAANEIVWRGFSEADWVFYKTFIAAPASALFMLAQLPLTLRGRVTADTGVNRV